ncbi:MAG: hypothetical protein EDM05_022865 [Leptolyngbya sp. IPPAS B-1204]
MKLAKQGDPRAIAYLITRTLGKYGITARASRQGHCLKLLMEAERVPHQSTMVKLVTQGMQKLNVATIETVKLYGRQTGQTALAWRQVIELIPQEPEPYLSLAKYDDEDASETPIFRLDDLDPHAMILLPVEPTVRLDDLDPDAMILLPVEPTTDLPTDLPTDLSTNLPTALSDLSDPSVDRPPGLPIADPSALAPTAPASAAAPDFQPELGQTQVNLPRHLTQLLLSLLWVRLIVDTLRVIYSLLGAGSVSLYTGLDLGNTNQPFASLLSVVVSIADFIFTPLDQLGIWINLWVVGLSLLWLYRIHASLRDLFGSYPISPMAAVMRFVLPIYNLWGIGRTLFTLARHLTLEAHLNRASQLIRRLTGWLYLFIFVAAGLQGFYFWRVASGALPSLWFYVARDSVLWLLSLVWLRLVRVIWRAVRRIYQERIAPFLPPPPVRTARSSPVSIRAVLLGAGAGLISLALLNCLLGLLAAFIFTANNLPPEAILPTFYDSESLLTLVLVGSFFCIGLGGFLTAALAPVAGLLHALAMGVLITLIGIALQRIALLPAVEEMPFWFQTASTGLIIPAALLGGGLHQWLRTL